MEKKGLIRKESTRHTYSGIKCIKIGKISSYTYLFYLVCSFAFPLILYTYVCQMSRYHSDGKVYVGDLGSNASKQELEDAFSYYGSLRNVWVARHPPGFAFVEFEDPRDAEDAVRGLDGRTICGRRARVELSNGKRLRDRSSMRRGAARPFHPEDRCYECGERGHYARDCSRHRSSRRKR